MKHNYYLILTIPFSFFLSCYQVPISDKQIGDQNTISSYNESFTVHKKKEKPRVNIEGAEISLLIQDPDIVTPTGIAVDSDDRIWIIENHTHVRQDDYPGPDVDRVLIFEGYLSSNPENKRVIEYATGFTNGMSLTLKDNGQVLIATRASIIQFTDLNNDFIADKRDTLIGLESEEKFSHNGMSGLVIGPDNKIYFQCGENFGSEYLMTGTDGRKILGEEREGGSIYRCNMDGSNLERIGTAIWNCFGMTFDPYGNLFSVENDPDSHPPCRLLHIVKGGNYGFEFNHGRDGLSPLTSWFGQIPGTLPMVSGTGEAPCGIMHYDASLFGEKIQSSLLVASWGDSVIQSYNLASNGGSFISQPYAFVEGKKNFAPVELAVDSKGGIIISDWASLRYPVHGKGKIWRISPPPNALEKIQKNDQFQLLNSPYAAIRKNTANEIISSESNIIDYLSNKQIKDIAKPNILWAAANNEHPQLIELLIKALDDKNELIRGLSVQILIEKNLIDNEKFYFDLFQNDPSMHVKRQAIYGLESEDAYNLVLGMFRENTPFIHTAIIEIFGKADNIDMLINTSKSNTSYERLGALLCLRRANADMPREIMKQYLFDPNYTNRQVALKWISEDRLTQFRDIVEESFVTLNDIDQKIFDAYMVAFQYLDGKWEPVTPRVNKAAKVTGWGDKATPHFAEGDETWVKYPYKRQPFLLKALRNDNFSSNLKARALSSMDPYHTDLTIPFLMELFNEGAEDLQIEVTRTLSTRITDVEACKTVGNIAKDKNQNIETRLEALTGLGNSAVVNESSTNTLREILSDDQEVDIIRNEAFKNYQSVSPDINIDQINLSLEKRPTSLDEWRKYGHEQGDEKSGARIFYSGRYQCGSCHRIDGRGGIYGQDLSRIGLNASKDRIIESILHPGDIISPEYVGYKVTTEEDDIYVGREDKDHDTKYHLSMILANGERKRILYEEIVEQKILDHSLMPSGLYETMTGVEFRDLIQFLSERTSTKINAKQK
jgi:putative membrane-bound dehydrogenase-like protein|tara:strand:- start:6987 stop:9995 length:3009 start_codon:yes stop_codon:yes gene_type:complete